VSLLLLFRKKVGATPVDLSRIKQWVFTYLLPKEAVAVEEPQYAFVVDKRNEAVVTAVDRSFALHVDPLEIIVVMSNG
jgi:hypothetical protein